MSLSLNSSESPINRIIERLSPLVESRDSEALADEIFALELPFGAETLFGALELMSFSYPDLVDLLDSWLNRAEHLERMGAVYEKFAEVVEAGGLQIEEHLRVTDQGLIATKQAAATLHEIYPELFDEEVRTLKGVGFDRIAGFLHPLSESHRLPGVAEPVVNFWTAASTLISAANGWLDGENSSETARNSIQACVEECNPAIDVDTLLFRARYCDRTLMQLSSLIVSGLEAKCDEAFGH